MAGATWTIEANFEPLEKALQRLSQATGNLKPAFADIGEAQLISHREGWQNQQAPDGAPWAPLDPKYRARKKRNKDKLLVLDDQLRGTLRWQAEPHQLAFGTDRVYGATHQFGRAEAGIPARPFLGLSAADLREVEELIADHLREAAIV